MNAQPQPQRLATLAALLLIVAACDGGLNLGGAPTPGAAPSGSPVPAGSPSAATSPGASASPGPSAAPTADPRLPAEAPAIEGEVISAEPAGAGQLHSGRIHVLAGDGGNQAVITLVSATAVWRRGTGSSLTRAAVSDLRVGQRVRAWSGGPVRESFPVQFDAKAVLILSDG